jgi:hypothetical protein
VLHRRFVLPVLVVVRCLQMVMRGRLILRGGLKVRVVLATMVCRRVLKSFAHVCSSLRSVPSRMMRHVPAYAATTMPQMLSLLGPVAKTPISRLR